MNEKHDIKRITLGPVARKLLVAAATMGVLSTAAPAHATSAATTATAIGVSLLGDATGLGTTAGTIVSLFSAQGTSAVELSEAAFDQIEAIVEDVVQTYAWEAYYNEVGDATNLALLYSRDAADNSASSLLFYKEEALDVITAADEAITRMKHVGLQGAPCYIMLSSMQLEFLQELSTIETLRGSSSNAAYYSSLRATRAAEHIDYLKSMRYAWDAVADEKRPVAYSTSKGGYYFYKSGLSYTSKTSYAAAVEARDTYLGGGQDAVLGEDFDAYLLSLSNIAGSQMDSSGLESLYGGTIRAAESTSKCIRKQSNAFLDSNAVQLGACTAGSEHTMFYYEPSTGYLRFAEDTAACLHKKDANWSNGNDIHVWSCDDGPEENKSWDYDAGTGYIKARYNSAKCIQKQYGNWDNGNPIHLWDCSAGTTASKTWKID